MSSKKQDISYKDFYEFVDGRTRDMNNTILRVEQKVDNLGDGRVSSLEKAVANLQGRMMYIPTIISIAISAFFFIIEFLTKPK